MCSTSKYYFWNSAKFCLPGIFSRYFAVPIFTDPNAPLTIGIIDVLIAGFFLPQSEDLLLEIFILIGNVKSISSDIFPLWSFIVMSGLLACIVLSIQIGISHKIDALSISTTFCGLCSYHFSAYGAL